MYNANNDIKSSINLMIKRTLFKSNSYNLLGLSEGNEVTDFTFAEFVNYGRIDTTSDTVFLQRDVVTAVRSSNEGGIITALPFVINALEDMMKDFQRASLLQKIPTSDAYLSEIKPILGYIDPLTAYQEYLDNLMQDFHTNYLISENKKREVINFDTYLKHFMAFIKHQHAPTPITLTSWQRSKHSSIFTSGLAIGLTNLKMDDDRQKMDFMSSKIFPYFKKVCVNRGFAISHNSPWVIVADLDSPKMKQYYPFGTVSAQGVFDRFYIKSYNKDIDIIKNNIIRYYNRFVNVYPHEKIISYCKNNKALTSYKYRSKTNVDKVNENFIEPPVAFVTPLPSEEFIFPIAELFSSDCCLAALNFVHKD